METPFKYLLADREFTDTDWFDFLIKEEICFYIRIKNNSLIQLSNGKVRKVYRFFPHTQGYTLKGAKLGKHRLNLSGLYLGRGEYLIMATDGSVKHALPIYKERWQIEMFFSCLKTQGFRLEETHMNHTDKTKILVALLALAFLWCYQLGEKLDTRQPIKTRSHGRKTNNLFRYGLDYLRRIISPLNQQLAWLKSALKLFEQTLSTMTLKIIS